jgi:hypothetical protein
MNTQILFRSRPSGEPHENNFRRVDHGIPTPVTGEVLCRTIYLSLDPYMRMRMNDAKSYTAPLDFGEVMIGATVGQVVESHRDGFVAGEYVVGYGGWQNYWVSGGTDLRKIDPTAAPISYHLGVLGMPGLTAYVGVIDIGQAKEGETVFVSGAAGAVGSIAGQIAKIRGCRVVGSAGSDEKCELVARELGFDACINYKSAKLGAEIDAACPSGIDVYVENTGGDVGDMVFRRLNLRARVALIGLIAQYNERKHHHGPDLSTVLVNRVTVRGMIVGDHNDRRDEFVRDVGGWLREGKIKVRETIVEGIENAPAAFIGMFRGQNTGKMLVRCAEDFTRVK